MESDIQRNILEKLTRYGDSLLGESNETKASSRLTASQQSTTQRKKTKKKKQTKNKTPTEAGQKQINEEPTNSKHNSMKEFEEELRMFKESRSRLSSEGAGELKERKEDGMRMKKRKAPEVIVFEDPTKRKRHRMKSMAVGGERGAQSEEEVELDQARHEVWKLGISGMDYRDRERQEAAKAIQLGAKPPRKDYVNYKELIEAQKHKKQEEREQRELNRQMGVKVSKRKEEKVQLQNKGFWTDKTQKKGVYIDGQLGKYKRGVQVIAKRDLAKMKNSRGKGNKR